MELNLNNKTLFLDYRRAVYLPEEKALVISDTHFGKASHFRIAGLPVNKKQSDAQFVCLTELVREYQPKTLLITGDLFHANVNLEVEEFGFWRRQFPSLEIVLIRGNHDILPMNVYREIGIESIENKYSLNGWNFVHHHLNDGKDADFFFSGHLHPGIKIINSALQRLKFPCFHLHEKGMILPAFNSFTGLNLLKKNTGTSFAIVDKKIVPVPVL